MKKKIEIVGLYFCNAPLKDRDIDTLILWCTHYPFLEDFIRKAIGSEVSLIDPAKETVLQVKKILNIRGILNSRNRQANHSFFINGDINKFRNTAENLLE